MYRTYGWNRPALRPGQYQLWCGIAQLLYGRVQPILLSYGTSWQGLGTGCQQPEHLVCQTSAGKIHLPCASYSRQQVRVVHTLSVYYHSSSVVAVYHRLHCIYRVYYPDRGWHHLMVQTPQGETTGRTAKAVWDRKGEGTVRIQSGLLHRDSARSAYPFDTDQRSSRSHWGNGDTGAQDEEVYQCDGPEHQTPAGTYRTTAGLPEDRCQQADHEIWERGHYRTSCRNRGTLWSDVQPEPERIAVKIDRRAGMGSRR